MSLTPRRVGILGAGLIGHKRAQSLTGLADLVGCFDPNQEAANRLSTSFEVQSFPSVEELVEHVGPQGLIIISTPNSSLVPLARIAISGGCNVLLEKPGAISREEFEALFEEANSRGLCLNIGYNHRFHPAVQALVQKVRSGEYGEVQLIRARYGHGGRKGYDKEWRASKATAGGGELLDQGCHLIDLVHFVAGTFELKYASLPTLYWDMEVEDNALMAGELLNGGQIWLHTSWTEWKNIFSFEVFCKTAKLEINGLGGSYGPETFSVYEMTEGLGPPLTTSVQYPPGDDSWVQEITDILNNIDTTNESAAGGTDGLAVLRIIEKAYSFDH